MTSTSSSSEIRSSVCPVNGLVSTGQLSHLVREVEEIR
jgi:hypothetical protein